MNETKKAEISQNCKSDTMSLLQELAGEINTRHNTLMGNARRLVSEAAEIGGMLAQIQAECEYGEFEEWLEQNIKFTKRNAYRYLALHEHQSQIASATNLTEAYKLIETLEAQKKQTETAKAMQRVAEYRKTGKKPEGWRRGTDDKLAQEEAERDAKVAAFKQEALNHKQKQAAEAKAQEEERERLRAKAAEVDARYTAAKAKLEQVNAEMGDTQTFIDFFSRQTEETEKRIKFKEAIRLSADGMNDPFQDAILDYLEGLADNNRRLEACHNIVKLVKGIINQLQSNSAQTQTA